MPIRVRELLDCLDRKLLGQHRGGRHNFILFYDDDGRLLTKAMLSHGRAELSDAEAGLIARNLGIPAQLLRDCAACTSDREAILPLMRRKAGL